jgi:hypothetical protein
MRLLFVTHLIFQVVLQTSQALRAFRSLPLLSLRNSAGFSQANRKILASLHKIGRQLVFPHSPSSSWCIHPVHQRHTPVARCRLRNQDLCYLCAPFTTPHGNRGYRTHDILISSWIYALSCEPRPPHRLLDSALHITMIHAS